MPRPYIHVIKLMSMNYMINDQASKQVAIEFAKWAIITDTWKSDLTFDEMYDCWMKELDDKAYDARVAHDSIDESEYDDFELQLEYMSGAYED